MEIQVNAYLVNGFDVEEFKINVNEFNYLIIRKRLELERIKLVKTLKKLQTNGEIKSIFRPANKKLKKEIELVVTTKRRIKESIDKIKSVFYR